MLPSLLHFGLAVTSRWSSRTAQCRAHCSNPIVRWPGMSHCSHDLSHLSTSVQTSHKKGGELPLNRAHYSICRLKNLLWLALLKSAERSRSSRNGCTTFIQLHHRSSISMARVFLIRNPGLKPNQNSSRSSYRVFWSWSPSTLSTTIPNKQMIRTFFANKVEH